MIRSVGSARRWTRNRGLLTAASAIVAVAAGIAVARPASAQEDEAPENEIVVTATRKPEALNRVPASIVARDQLQLDKQGVRSIKNIARITPGGTFGQSGGRGQPHRCEPVRQQCHEQPAASQSLARYAGVYLASLGHIPAQNRRPGSDDPPMSD